MQTYFKLECKKRYEALYKSGKPIYLTSDEHIVAFDGKNVTCINYKLMKKLKNLSLKDEIITYFIVNPHDNTVLLARSDLTIRMTDRSQKVKDKIWNSNHNYPVTSMALDKYSKVLVTGSADKNIRITYLDTFHRVLCQYHKSMVNILKYHGNSDIVVSSSAMDREIASWNTKTGKLNGVFIGHQSLITSLEIVSKSNILISTSKDETLIIWDLLNFNQQSIIPMNETIESCILTSPNDMNLNNLEDEYMILCGGQSGIMKVVSPLKKCVAKTFNKASLFNKSTNDDINQNDLNNLKMIRYLDTVSNHILVVRECDSFELYDKKMGKVTEISGMLDGITNCLCLGENNDFLLVTEPSSVFRLFDMRSDKDIWPCVSITGGHVEEITSVDVFGPGNSFFVTSGKDGRICLWEFSPENYNRNPCQIKYTYLFSENSDCFITLVKGDWHNRRIYVQYTLAGLTNQKNTKSYCARILKFNKSHSKIETLAEQFKIHKAEVNVMDISNSSEFFATGSNDKLAKVWKLVELESQHKVECVAEFNHPKGVVWSVQFDKNNEDHLLTGSANGSVTIWDISSKIALYIQQTDYSIYQSCFMESDQYAVILNSNNQIQILDMKKKGKVFSQDNKSKDKWTSFNLIKSESDDAYSSLVAFGPDSLITFYKNASSEYTEEVKLSNAKRVEEMQDLENAKFAKQYKTVFKLALKLNLPQVMYDSLESMTRFNRSVAGLEYVKVIQDLITELNDQECKKLYKITTKWMLCRKFKTASFIICEILERVKMSKLTEFQQDIEITHKNFKKHINKVEQFSTSVGLMGFAVDRIRSNNPHVNPEYKD